MPTPLPIVTNPREARARCDEARCRGLRVSFVPTMGALHEGHLRLVDVARERGGVVVVSLFVNPTQFAPGEDFAKYPRDLDDDVAKLSGRGVDVVISPSVEAMYPKGACTRVTVSGITAGLCGAHRPGHFAGVATVVTKLFNIVGPCTAIFGRKDYQQLAVVRRLVADLDMPIEIVGVPIVRDVDGLALSSRNAYLSTEERQRGLSISRGLGAAHSLYENGDRNVDRIRAAVAGPVGRAADIVDYVSVVDPDSLEELSSKEMGERALVAVAARFGATRLIDNTVLGEDAPPVPSSADRT
jgi:pantoate--beta-alanine ligase